MFGLPPQLAAGVETPLRSRSAPVPGACVERRVPGVQPLDLILALDSCKVDVRIVHLEMKAPRAPWPA